MSFKLNRSSVLGQVCLLLTLGTLSWHQAYGQEAQVQTLSWTKKIVLETPATALQKMPANLRLLPGAPKEFLRMKAQGMEIKALETDDPIVGLLVKATGGREELEAIGGQVGAQIGDIFSVRLPLSRLSALANLSSVVKIEPSMLRKPTLDKSIRDAKADAVHQGNYSTAPPSYAGYTGQNVLVGICDSGIDWKHADFIKDNDGTSRIAYIWDQNLVPQGMENLPEGFSYGVEYSRQQINDEIDGTPRNFVRTRDNDGHGTHVAGTAAGDGSATGGIPAYTYVGMAPRADIVAIATNFYDTGIIDAVDYMMRKSDELGKPAVLNISLGSQYGPHDGTELICQAIDVAANSGRINIVISAGNEGTDAAHGEYIHAEGTVTAGKSDTTVFVVPTYTSNSGGGNDFILFNMWYQGNDRLTVKVLTPRGYSWTAISGSDNSNTFTSTSDGAIYIDNASTGVDPNNGDRMCYIQIWDYYSTSPPYAGTWRIIVTGATVAESGHYDNWLDASQVGSKWVYFNAASASLDELVGIPGVAAQAITVAAHSTKTSWTDYLGRSQTVPGAVLNDLAYFSSPGPTRDDPGFITGRQKPDISAPGFGVVAALSSNATYYASSIYRNQDQVHLMIWGTSMSAPHVTGAVALLLEKNPKLTPAQIKTALTTNARSDAFTGTVPNMKWGAGKLDIQAAIGTVTQPDRAVDLFPTSFSKYALAATTAEYQAVVKNLGTLADSYNLAVTGNAWATTFWNAAGTSQITNTGTIQPGAQVQIHIRVAVPAGTAASQKDEATIRVSSVGNSGIAETGKVVTRTPGQVPWSDNFASTTLDPVKWPVNIGPAEVNTQGMAVPSTPYSLNLDGDTRGADEVQTQALNLGGMNGVTLEYYYQRTGSGDSPESGDDLWVDYLNSAGEWKNLKQYSGADADMTTFTKETIILPADAHHTFFQLRFRNKAAPGPNDDWFIDDVSLTPPPDIAVAPDSLGKTLKWPNSSAQTLTIRNEGQGSLSFQISSSPRSGSLAALTDFAMPHNADPVFVPRQKTADGDSAGDYYTSSREVLNTKFSETVVAGLNVALVAADHAASNSDVQAKLMATGLFSSVTIIDAATTIPTLAQLRNYDAVLVWRNLRFLNDTQIGDVLADYVDSGGGVVLGMWAMVTPNTIAGRFNSQNYWVITPSDLSASGFASLGTVFDSSHPIMANVRSFNGGSSSYRPGTTTLVSGATLIANWSDGKPLVATRIINGTRRVDLGFRPPSTDATVYGWDSSTDGARLLANALAWAAGKQQNLCWLSFTPTAGTVSPGSSLNITVTFNSACVMPGRTYQAHLNISSNDPDESMVRVPATMIVSPEDYFVDVDPASSQAEGYTRDVVTYPLRIRNYGIKNDSYTLRTNGNKWRTQIFDSTGTTQITTTPTVVANGNYKILVKVTIDSLAANGSQDTVRVLATSAGDPTKSSSAKLTTTSLGPRGTIPWSDAFPTTTLDPIKWTYNAGPAEVNDLASNEPSPPYSLNLDGISGNKGDEVRTQAINLAGKSGILLRYYYQAGGGAEPPDAGDSLKVDYQNAAGSWVNLVGYTGTGTSASTFTFQEITLPAGAYHANFRLRFRVPTSSGAGMDDWFVDDVSLALPPVIAVSPTSFSVTLDQGDSTIQTLVIENRGTINAATDLRYSISIQPRSATQQVETVEQVQPSQTGNISPLSQSQSGDYSTTMAVTPPQAAPASTTASLRILSWTGYVDFLREYPNTLAALRQFFTDFTLTETSTQTPSALQALLSAADVFLIPEQETSTNLTSLGASWASILNTFVANGGSVIVLEHGAGSVTGSSTLLNGTGLMNITIQSTSISSVSVRAVDASHPIAAGLPNIFSAMNGNNTHISNGVKIIESVSTGGAVVSANVIGRGHVVYIGMDYYEYNSEMARLLANTVQWQGARIDWLTLLSPSSGTVVPGARQNVNFKFSAKKLPVDTTVYANIVVSNNDPRNPTVTIPATLKTKPRCTSPVHFTFTANTGTSYALLIDNATLDGNRLQRCDEIGVFTPAGLCVGAVVWNDTLPLAFSAWQDDPQTPVIDGYRVGEKMTFRIWDSGSNAEYPATAIYTIGNGEFGFGALARLSLGAVTTVTQSVNLRQGWNWISFNVEPSQPRVDSVFANVAGLEILQNCAGKIYVPGVINQIGNLNVLESYVAYMNRSNTVTVRGRPIQANTPIILPPGWNCIPYLPNAPMATQMALQSIVANLNIVKDDSGHFYTPRPIVVDNIKQMRAGRGYKAHLAARDTLIYPITGSSTAKSFTPVLTGPSTTSKHFHYTSMTGESYSIVVASVKIDDHEAKPGDEIAVFTASGRCVGAGVWNESGILALTAWQDDARTQEVEGYQPGDIMSFRLWDQNTKTEIPLTAAFKRGNGTFGDEPYALAELTAQTLPKVFALRDAYPNPFNPETNIEYDLPRDTHVTIKIYDVMGREVRTLVDEPKLAGYHRVVWDSRTQDGNFVTSGIYLCRMKAADFTQTKRVLLLK
ncbi:MAG: S8 family serine peptidase [candidate division KSB1 bacterium]|nr:S8 family serine peptidase [candidate division KSB1 bacterium]MDZ7303869.1 S8 family serine peptidase [candidate division KSB1 bacterium]MDZ7313207.1 S8 family serine peptidase [candidate division KSB1 bacterium]